jgi:hypothetical protein
MNALVIRKPRHKGLMGRPHLNAGPVSPFVTNSLSPRERRRGATVMLTGIKPRSPPSCSHETRKQRSGGHADRSLAQPTECA